MKATVNRREFVALASGVIACSFVGRAAVPTGLDDIRVQAIAFDAFVIFDPRSIFALAEELFPGKGSELSNAWRTRQFEYTWLRTVAGRYTDFWQVTEDALIFAARDLKLDLNPQRRAQLMNSYLDLKDVQRLVRLSGICSVASLAHGLDHAAQMRGRAWRSPAV